MESYLPIGIEELLAGAVETARIEFKASWNEKSTGPQVLKTLCAFANDLQNLNGGYILIGIEELDGVAVRPAKGLPSSSIDNVQKWIRGDCNRIVPVYMPVIDAPLLDGQRILVLWAPASETRPHQAPDRQGSAAKYWVRIGSETVQARGDILTTLMQQTARVPFDDRRSLHATNNDIDFHLVKKFLPPQKNSWVASGAGKRPSEW